MHFNLHKTFATPHGGGGPGASAVGASKYLAKFLPSPLVEFNKITKMYYFDYSRPLSVGRIRSFYGNFGIIIRAWVYIREMGKNGLKKATEFAVLNANYVKKRLKDSFNLVYNNDCLHEVVFNDKSQRSQNISTMNIAKRLIDYGIHPPTIYFPLVVESAMMIEPTETETKESLDMMCNAFLSIANESLYDPKTVISAPNNSFIRQINESFVAKNPVLTWKATS
jgi:glycine dehydrogenase subunit 2